MSPKVEAAYMKELSITLIEDLVSFIYIYILSSVVNVKLVI